VACATTPATHAPDSEHVANAQRFLHSWGAGEIALAGIESALEAKAKEQPDTAELCRRAFSNVQVEDLENMMARVYARHISKNNILELMKFSESDTGQRFFRAAITAAMEGQQNEDVIRQFNADELNAIIKFAQSDAFQAFTQAQPEINRELSEEGRKFGAAVMRDYKNQQGIPPSTL